MRVFSSGNLAALADGLRNSAAGSLPEKFSTPFLALNTS